MMSSELILYEIGQGMSSETKHESKFANVINSDENSETITIRSSEKHNEINPLESLSYNEFEKMDHSEFMLFCEQFLQERSVVTIIPELTEPVSAESESLEFKKATQKGDCPSIMEEYDICHVKEKSETQNPIGEDEFCVCCKKIYTKLFEMWEKERERLEERVKELTLQLSEKDSIEIGMNLNFDIDYNPNPILDRNKIKCDRKSEADCKEIAGKDKLSACLDEDRDIHKEPYAKMQQRLDNETNRRRIVMAIHSNTIDVKVEGLYCEWLQTKNSQSGGSLSIENKENETENENETEASTPTHSRIMPTDELMCIKINAHKSNVTENKKQQNQEQQEQLKQVIIDNEALLESIKSYEQKLILTEEQNKYLQVENYSLMKSKAELEMMKKEMLKTKSERDMFKKKLIIIGNKSTNSKIEKDNNRGKSIKEENRYSGEKVLLKERKFDRKLATNIEIDSIGIDDYEDELFELSLTQSPVKPKKESRNDDQKNNGIDEDNNINPNEKCIIKNNEATKSQRLQFISKPKQKQEEHESLLDS